MGGEQMSDRGRGTRGSTTGARQTIMTEPATAELQARQNMAEKLIADLRRRLLDLRNSNRLLNFKFSDRARTHVCIVDELLDVLYGHLINNGKKLTFVSLPDPEDKPEDEKSDEFILALAAARGSDEEYLRALEALEEEDETSAKGQEIERALKDRVRQQLGWPQRPTRESMTPAEYAQARGIDPPYALPRPKGGGRDQRALVDGHVQTLLFADQLERKLSGIREGARTALSEMGVNILYAAFGYLE
jgi:hypothetical protein